jgi:putative ABC transport system permease protein
MGVEGDPGGIAGMLVLQEGRWLRRGDEVVIGTRLSRDRRIGLGDTLRLSGRDFTVVGIGRLRGIGPGADSLVYMDFSTLQERAGTGDVVTAIVVDTTQPAVVREHVTEIGSLAAEDRQELLDRVKQAQAASVAVNWTVSLLALGIGALFVSSMLGRSVIERRLEFATLKAIGLPNRTVLLIVALEAAMICLVASVIGILISLVLGYLMNSYYDALFGLEGLYSPDAGIFANVFVLALGLGCIAGLLPARRATRVDPIDILRES